MTLGTSVAPEARGLEEEFSVELVGTDERRTVRWGDFLSRVEQLRAMIRKERLTKPLIAVNSRSWLAACLVACRAENSVAVLPPNLRSNTLSGLLQMGLAERALHDGDHGLGIDVRGTQVGSSGVDARRVADWFSERQQEPWVELFTSGSTGVPARAIKTGAQLWGEAGVLCEAFGLGRQIRVLSTAPPHHIYGLLFGVLVPLVAGGVIIENTPVYGGSIAKLRRQLSANVLCSVPPHLHGMLELPAEELAGFFRVFCSGARLPTDDAALLKTKLGFAVTEVLGSTETGGIAWRDAGEAHEWSPLPGVVVSANESGDLLIDSPFLDASLERPFATKDSVVMVDERRFRHLGRSDAIVKVGGERVSLQEVERYLLEIEGVVDAAVLSVEDPGPRQTTICAVVAGSGLVPEELKHKLAKSLVPVAIPRRIATVSSLPREANGKLQRQALLELLSGGGTGEAPPRGGAGDTGLAGERT